MALTVGLALLATVIVMGSKGAEVDSKIRELEIKVQKLEQTKQLKIEGINETRQVETSSQVITKEPEKASTQRVISIPPNKEGIASEIRRVFGDEFAVKVATCESGLNPRAVGSHGERGIFQIHPVHISSIQKAGFTWDQMFDPNINITYAKMLYNWNGWQPWTCSRLI
jgi:hypothetical protein